MLRWRERGAVLIERQRPLIVCLCGSTRFGAAFREANLCETLKGHIVLSIGCDLQSDDERWADPVEREQIKQRLDILHLRKIDLCDYVLVLNVEGYIGESTQREIQYAESIGRVVKYLETGSEQLRRVRENDGSEH